MKKRTHHTISMTLMTAALMAALLFAPGAMAAPPGEGPPGERLHERMIELRSKLLRKRVGLDAAKITQVEGLLKKGDAARKEAHQAMKRSRKALRQLVKDDATDEAAFDQAITAMFAAHEQLHALRSGELKRLRRMLSAKEMGKLVLALGRLRHKMERIRDGRRGGGDDLRRGKRGDRGDRGHRGRRGDRPRRDDW